MLATGLYTIAEASRLTLLKPSQARRCVKGYQVSKKYPALWQSQIRKTGSTISNKSVFELGFTDLIQLRFVREFLAAGVSFRTLRLCMERAQEELKTQYPFVGTKKLLTDGSTIFLDTVNEDRECTLDLKRLQMVFKKILEPTFLDIAFDAGTAIRWWPLQGKKSIVIDPAIAFGQPTVTKRGVPTQTIWQAFKAEKTIGRVAKLYDLDDAVVQDALSYEKSLAR